MPKTIEDNLAHHTLKKMKSVWRGPGFHLVLIYDDSVPLYPEFTNEKWFCLVYPNLKKLEKEHKLKRLVKDLPVGTNLVVTVVPCSKNDHFKTIIRDLNHLLPSWLLTQTTTVSEFFYPDLLHIAKARFGVTPGTMYGYKKDWKILSPPNWLGIHRPFAFDNLFVLSHRGTEILNNIQDRCTGPQIKVLRKLLVLFQQGNRFTTWTQTCKDYTLGSLKSMEKLGIVEVKEKWKQVNHKDGSFSTRPDHKFRLTPLGQVFLDCAVALKEV